MGKEDRESDFLIERFGCSSYGPPDFVCYHGAGDVVIAIWMCIAKYEEVVFAQSVIGVLTT